MCLVMFAWSRVHGATLMAMTHTGLLACMRLDVFAWSRVNLLRLFSSVIKWCLSLSLSIYIYIVCVSLLQDHHHHG